MARRDGRLVVLPFVPLADWLRSADVCVTKAGPATIAEAACCRTPLLLTSHLPGQERGNIDLVVSAGAGRRASRRPALLAAEVGRLCADPTALAAMRAAATALASPGAARRVADAIAGLAGSPASPGTAARAGAEQAAGPAGPAPAGPDPADRTAVLTGPAGGVGPMAARGSDAAR